MMLRILLVSPLPPPNGGITRWSVRLLNWLDTKPGVSVRAVDISTRWRAVEDMTLWKRIAGGIAQGVRDAWKTAVQLIVFRPNVLHLNTSAQLRGPWDTAVIALAALLHVPSFYHIRMGRLPQIIKRKGWEWWGMRWAIKLATRVIVLDKNSEEAIKHYTAEDRIVRLPNAVDTAELRSEQHQTQSPCVLYLGHIIPTKGMKELMETWRQLGATGWTLRLGGLGSPDYINELRIIAGAQPGVEFLGDLPAETAMNHLRMADLFVLPTYTEGFPNVILEAMAAGKPIISTHVGAIPEMLDAETNTPCGLVIAPRNTGQLLGAFQRLLSDSKLRGTLGQRARAKAVRAYSADVVFNRLLGLWSDIAGVHDLIRNEVSPVTTK